jgi:MoaA/NifB/PqqE/SkfB family radical SAM enzyme
MSKSIRNVIVDKDGHKETQNCVNKDVDLSNKFCPRPWFHLEINSNPLGRVFLCCPSWLMESVGFVKDEPLKEVFNSEKSKQIRKSILDGSYKYCNKKLCPHIQGDKLPTFDQVLNDKHFQFGAFNACDPEFKDIVVNKKLEGEIKFFNLCYDESCNLSCPSCRTEKISFTQGKQFEDKLKIQEKIIEEIFSKPHDRFAIVNITGSGDAFGSKLFRDLLFNIDGSKYPNVRINLQTNGVLLTPKYWDKMKNIHDNIKSITISVDAGKEETYNLVRRGGNWNILLDNLLFLGERRKELNFFYRLDFVVQALNYKEMKDFIKIGIKSGVKEVFFQLINDWGTFSVEDYNKHCIWKDNHPEFNDFMDTLKDDIFNHEIVQLGNLSEYRKKALQ